MTIDGAVTESTHDERGWYFYGITRRESLAPLLAAASDAGELAADPTGAPSSGALLQLIEFSELAALVRPVRTAVFSAAVVNARVQNASALEQMVQCHNRVIEVIHARQPILPAKFGMVYARTEDVVTALRGAHDTLLERLARLDGCDEWGVHVYVKRSVVREMISMSDPTIRRLHDERNTSRPGRAFFVDQRIRDALENSTEEALSTIRQQAFDRLADRAVGELVTHVGVAVDSAGEVEILRASFLVARDAADRFKQETQAVAGMRDGLRCEYSGPWPPYSFAEQNDERAS